MYSYNVYRNKYFDPILLVQIKKGHYKSVPFYLSNLP